MWAKIYIFSIPLVFFIARSEKKRSWLLCVYCAVYALSCNILIINCFLDYLPGRPANVKIRLAVFAWANDYSPLQCRKILIRCPADRNPSKTESNHSNRMFCLICCYLPDFSRSDFYPLIVETVHAPSNSQIINKISQTEHAPSLQAKLYVMSCGQKSIKNRIKSFNK